MVDLINGDCIEEMQRLIDEGVQVDSVVTDPPYHLTSIVKRFGKASIDDNTYTSEKVRNGADGYSRLIRTGFMGKEWDGGDIAFRAETWELALKLLKPGGHLLAFSASRNYHRMAVAIEDAGFEIRDQLMWLYGSGFPKSQGIGKVIDKKVGKYDTNYGTTTTNTQQKRINIHGEERGSRKCNRCQKDVKHQYDCKDTQCGMKYNYSSEEAKQWAGWGTALKPAHEPIVMARKPISEKSIADNVLKHRTGGINIDGCRIEGEVKRPDTNPDFRDVAKKAMAQGGQDKLNFNQITGAKRKTTVRKSRDDGNVWTDDNSGMKQEANHFADADPRGRYPANVMHDGSDVVKDIFPNNKNTRHMSYKRSGGEFIDNIPNQEEKSWFVTEEGSAARFFYCPKTSKSERHSNLDDHETSVGANGNKWTDQDYRKGDTKPTTERKNTHPTVKPVELMKYLCRLVTPKGGTVLDPFMGSGSTGMAAKDEGFDFIGIEKEKEYFEICESRIKRFAPLMDFM